MADPREDAVVLHLRRSREALERAEHDSALISSIANIAEHIAQSLRGGGKLLLAGNGGSAADAQHIAAEFTGRYIDDRPALAAIALTTDTSALTALGNDYGFEQVFARQLQAIARPSDVFAAFSTSGRSPNILAALSAARELKLRTIGFTRSGPTAMHPLCDLVLEAPSTETALIQQIHITAGHAICGLVERDLFGASIQAKPLG